jgi:glycosyltransferase involved in cell wall biosynthesis
MVVMASISTSVPEGIPVSLMEAMSYKIPVIATDCGGTKELVDGESGIIVNQNNSKQIAHSIFELINDPDLYTKIGNNGRNKIMQDFDTLKNADDLIKLF